MNLSIFLTLFFFIILFIIVNGVSSPLTKTQYIVNNYMYILLGLIIVASTVIYIDKNNINYLNIFSIFLVSMLSLVIILISSPTNYIIKHVAWLIFMISIGFMMVPMVKKTLQTQMFNNIIITLLTIIVLTSFIAYMVPPNTFNTLNCYAFIILCGLIIFELLDIIFGNVSTFRQNIYGAITIVIFTIFLLYDTQTLINVNENSIIDYPKSSLNIFLDIVNLFSGMSQMN